MEIFLAIEPVACKLIFYLTLLLNTSRIKRLCTTQMGLTVDRSSPLISGKRIPKVNDIDCLKNRKYLSDSYKTDSEKFLVIQSAVFGYSYLSNISKRTELSKLVLNFRICIKELQAIL